MKGAVTLLILAAILISTAYAEDYVFPNKDLLVKTEWLADKLKEEKLLIVDVRSEEQFTANHIPEAVPVNLDLLRTDIEGVKVKLLPPEQLTEKLADLGLNSEKRIVIYSAMAKPIDFADATLLFWILEYMGYKDIAIVDGGFAKWSAEKRPLESGTTVAVKREIGKLEADKARIADKQWVLKALSLPTTAMIDLRPPEFFFGLDKKDYVKRYGHIPGAKCVPLAYFLAGEFNTVRDPKQIAEMLISLGITKEKQMVAYCNTGREGSVGYFMLRLMAYPQVRVYDGSLADWSQDENLPMIIYKWDY